MPIPTSCIIHKFLCCTWGVLRGVCSDVLFCATPPMWKEVRTRLHGSLEPANFSIAVITARACIIVGERCGIRVESEHACHVYKSEDAKSINAREGLDAMQESSGHPKRGLTTCCDLTSYSWGLVLGSMQHQVEKGLPWRHHEMFIDVVDSDVSQE